MTESNPKGTTRRAPRRKKEDTASAQPDAATANPPVAESVASDPSAAAEAPKKRARRTVKKTPVETAEATVSSAPEPATVPAAAGEAATAPKARKPRRTTRKAAPAEEAVSAPVASAPPAAVEVVVAAPLAEHALPEVAEGGGPVSEDGQVGGRPRRRRSRRGGKGRGTGQPGQSGAEEAVTAPAAEAASFAEAPQNAGELSTAEAQPGAPFSELPGEPGVPVEGATKRRRRRRRRRNRRGKGPDGMPLAPGAAPHEEDEGEEIHGDEGGHPEVAAATEASAVVKEPTAEESPREGAGRKRRGSRRRRGRGGEGAAGPETEAAEEGLSTVEAAEAASVEGAETEDDDLDGDIEYTDTSASSDSRRVMMIDGTHPEEIRVAIVNDNILDYFEFENQRRKQFKGNIYKGKVINIAPAIEAAFVEFGGGRHGFLPLNEYCGGALTENLDNWDEDEKRPPLRSGMEILVQVTKEESSVKGAALTSYISIAGRYLVMMLGMKRFGISKKITGEKERERLRKQMEKLEYPDHLGFIVRTEGEGRNLKDLKADLENLIRLWHRVLDGGKSLKAPALLYEEQDIVIRTLRDNYSSDFAEVIMNSEDSHRKAVEFFDIYYPKQKNKLKLYRQKRPLFSKFNLDEQLDKATSRRVGLPSGGHIVIDKTEALWSIDVNSGRSSKDRDIEDTAFRTNKEAAEEVTRQLRIRDMGGLIVVDFIDMENKNHIKEVERTIKDGLRKDKAKNDVSAMGKFGLVAISRQRMGISFFDVMLKDCDLCAGTGFVLTPDAMAVRLLRKLHDEMSREGVKEVLARLNPALLETLLNQKRDEISRLERLCNTRVSFLADHSLPVGGFHIGPAPVA